MKNNCIKIRLIMIIACYPLLFFSQKNPSVLKNKKLGLVLSGGGAKGMAHIGVLKAIDSLHLKVNYIGGTSMGSIVSALYACGYSGDEIESRLKKMDWAELFNDEIPLSQVSIEEKADHGRFLLEIPFNKGKVSLPRGIIRGPNLYNELVKLTFPVIDKYDYDSLPIPLRINAVNLETGENVVFRKGFLPSAMRASMSIPSVFYPVEMDSGYFVDGGVLRNTLIPEVKAMGSDYVIVSFTGSKLATKAELSSVTSILSHVFFITGSYDLGQHQNEADLFIQPVLSDKDAGSFKKADIIINSGIEATMLKFNELAKLGNDTLFQKDNSPWKEHNDEEILNEAFYIESVFYQNLGAEHQRFFETNSGIHKGKTTSLKEFFKGIKNAYSTLRYDYIYYEFVFKGYTEDGKKKLDLRFKVNEAAKTKVRIGLHYDTDFGSGFMVNMITRDLLIKRSRLVLEADIAQSPRAKASYSFFLDKKYRLILGTLNQFEQDKFEYYKDKLASESYKTNIFKSYTWLQWKLSRNCAINSGYELEYMDVKPNVSSDSIFLAVRNLNALNHGILTYFQYNTLNRLVIPTKGIRIQVRHRYIFSSQLNVDTYSKVNDQAEQLLKTRYPTYHKLTAFMESYIPLTKKITYCTNLDYGMIFNDNSNELDFFFIGSVEKNRTRVVPQYGYRNSELIARNFSTLNTGIQFNVYKALYLKAAYAASVLNNGSYKALYTNITNPDEPGVVKTSGFGFTASYLIPKAGPLSFTVHKSFDRRLVFLYVTFGYKFQLL